MSSIRLLIRSLWHYRVMHLSVGLGVIAATAVLTGALVVGDSMRGSLRDLTLDRLGRIDTAVTSNGFFRQELGTEVRAASDSFITNPFPVSPPAIVLAGSVIRPSDEHPARANNVTILGVTPDFAKLYETAAWEEDELASRSIIINRPLAERLGIDQPGEELLLRLPTSGAIPADSPLGQKRDTVARGRATVSDIIPAEGPGRFAMQPSQQEPLVAYVPLEWLQDRLDREGLVNTLFFAHQRAEEPLSDEWRSMLRLTLQPTLEDYGMHVDGLPDGSLRVTCDAMIFSEALESEIEDALAGQHPRAILTYLANAMELDEKQTPYSTIAAIPDSVANELTDLDGKPIGPIEKGAIVLNAWAAEDLGAKPGDTIDVTYFEPEDMEGESKETTASFRVQAICSMNGLGADASLTPDVEGVTDRLDIDDWDPPFEFDAERIRDKDEAYWDEHRAAPKAFIAYKAGEKLWAGRFGRVTSFRIRPSEGALSEDVREELRSAITPEAGGLMIVPLKQQGLAASAGATPFSVLFMAFSFFLIAAALMLVGLLFRLGVERRASDIGALLALGFTPRQVRRLLALEGVLAAVAFSLVGALLGVAYAKLMLHGLTTAWLDAIGTPFLELHVATSSLCIGAVSGLLVVLVVIYSSARRLGRIPPRRLLAGDTTDEREIRTANKGHQPYVIIAILLLLAISMSAGAVAANEAMRAGLFFGVGSLVLATLLYAAHVLLGRGERIAAIRPNRASLLRLAIRNAARNPGRSTLSMGLIASACFLIIAVSAFHLDPTTSKPSLDGPSGGYSLIAESDMPIFHAMNTDVGRYELGFSSKDMEAMAHLHVQPLRALPGDNASCLNLYQAARPRILGLPDAMIQRGGFAWAGSLAETEEEKDNPWLLLQKPLPLGEDGVPQIPVVVEKNTANYALHKFALGDSLTIDGPSGKPIRLVFVAFLGNGMLQGELLADESVLLEHFPSINGYRFFLIETPLEPPAWQANRDAAAEILNERLADYGFHAESTGDRMARFLAVQNTYLLTFQSLGGLGLLLGTFGLGAVQMRNVLERRREMALLRAVGFLPERLALLVMLENLCLLLCGLAIGCVAALFAISPHLFGEQAAVPWPSLGGTLLLVLLAGFISSLLAMREVLRLQLLPTLRGD